MNLPARERPHILFLFSDTGGGHRSATEAIIEALQLKYQDRITTEMVDILKDYAPRPFNSFPSLYPTMVRAPQLWGFIYHLSNGRRRTHLINAVTWPYIRRSMRRLISRHPSHLIVSVHPLVNDPMLRALGANRLGVMTMVTDLVTAHAFWYHPKVDLCIVPTDIARQQALEFGMMPDKVIVAGLPVAERFSNPGRDQCTLRTRLGWPQDRLTVLLVGGGEGMGPIEKTARVISKRCPSTSLVIIAGRNQNLKGRLDTLDWPIPTFVYGFVHQMPEFMRAADILVTKAGPGTISEALISGIPMVLNTRLPGQEDGNIDYVVSKKAGVWAPRAEQIVTAIQYWQENPHAYAQAVNACLNIARPRAARQIARILFESIKAQTVTIT